jgi:hypothetical protein
VTEDNSELTKRFKQVFGEYKARIDGTFDSQTEDAEAEEARLAEDAEEEGQEAANRKERSKRYYWMASGGYTEEE